MNDFKTEILNNLCYTDLVYGRINKKLKTELSRKKIEAMVLTLLKETDESRFQKRGKNIYITNDKRNIRLTINSFSNRVITADRLR